MMAAQRGGEDGDYLAIDVVDGGFAEEKRDKNDERGSGEDGLE
jgi:hypothetical protein